MKGKGRSQSLLQIFNNYVNAGGDSAIKYPEIRLEYLGDKIFKSEDNFGFRSPKLFNSIYVRVIKSAK